MPTDQPATYLAIKINLSKNRKDSNSQDLLIVRIRSEIVTSLELFVAKGIYNQQVSYQ
jgi:hypothetical protein